MKLTVTSAGGRTEALELGRQVVLGRDPSCDVVLDDNLVSRRHAQLEVDDSGRMVLRDLGSRNGTFVNGQRIEGAVVLGGNERIGIGDAQISLAPRSLRPRRPTRRTAWWGPRSAGTESRPRSTRAPWGRCTWPSTLAWESTWRSR